MKTALLKTNQLEQFLTRELRQNVIDEIKKSISENGFLMGHNLTVVGNKVIDGNHRLSAAQESDISELPCIIYEEDEVNAYKLAEQLNSSNDTYAKQDLFDVLFKIGKLKDEGKTNVEIADLLGWNESAIKNHSALLSKVTPILNIAKTHQKGRVTNEVTYETYNFTEGWFRTSGLYDLSEEFQLLFFEKFKADSFTWNKGKVQQITAKYKLWQDMIVSSTSAFENPQDVINLIKSGTFTTMDQLNTRIAEIQKKAKNKLLCGDAVLELAKLDDGIIDVVITDAPYGVDYSSNRSKFTEHVAKEGIANDTEEAFILLDNVCEVLSTKTKSDTHLYFFTSWKVYAQFESIISKHFDIKNVIVWDKGNHSMGDLTGAWGNRHELIIFATKGNRNINKRKADILAVPRISTQNAIHPTQKPEALIKELLEVSAIIGDTVCDPFMGSGSTIKAIKEYSNQINYIGIEIDKERFEKAKAYIGGGE